jgi:hypothetical protein
MFLPGGNTLSHYLLQGLELRPNTTYYVSIRAINGAGLSAESPPTLLQVDATPPTCDFFLDGTTPGLEQATSQRLDALSATWQCRDAESGLPTNLTRIGLGFCAGDASVVPLQVVSPHAGATRFDSLQLRAGFFYYFLLQLTNGAGLVYSIASPGVLVDDTAPSNVSVRSGYSAGLHEPYWGAVDQIHGFWAATDAESQVAQVEVGVIEAGGVPAEMIPAAIVPAILPFTPVDIGPSAFSLVLPASTKLRHAQSYQLVVRVTNGVGLFSVGLSLPFIVDLTPPECVFLLSDYQRVHNRSFIATNLLAASWNCSDPESGLSSSGNRYSAFQLFHDGSSSILRSPASIGSRNSIVTPVPYQAGGMFQLLIDSENAVGLLTSFASPPFILDITRPVHGDVIINPMADFDLSHTIFPISDAPFQTSLTSLSASWPEILDPESGICNFQWAIGQAPYGTDVQDWTSVGILQTATNSTLTLEENRAYYVSVIAINCAGFQTVVCSRAISVIRQAAIAGSLSAKLFVTPDFVVNDALSLAIGAGLDVRWHSFRDDNCGIYSYQLSFPSLSANPSVHLAPVASSYLLTGLNYTNGTVAIVQLTAINWAGLAVTVTEEIPLPYGTLTGGVVRDGTGQHGVDNLALGDPLPDVDYQTVTHALYVSWMGFHTPFSSTILYECGIGTSPSSDDVRPFQYMPIRQLKFGLEHHILSRLALQSGQQYYSLIRATDPVMGTQVTVASNGITIDTTPPICTFLGIATARNHSVPYFANLPALVNWRCEDPESGIAQVEVSLATLPGGNDLLTAVATPDELSTQSFVITASRLVVVSAMNLFATIRVQNGAKLMTTDATFTPSIFHDRLPHLGSVLITDSAGTQVHFLTNASATELYFSWPGWSDTEGLPLAFVLCLGREPEHWDVLNCTDVGHAESVTVSVLDLLVPLSELDGSNLYAHVIGTTVVGLSASQTSEPLLILLAGLPSLDGIRLFAVSQLPAPPNWDAVRQVWFQSAADRLDISWDGAVPAHPDAPLDNFQLIIETIISDTSSGNFGANATSSNITTLYSATSRSEEGSNSTLNNQAVLSENTPVANATAQSPILSVREKLSGGQTTYSLQGLFLPSGASYRVSVFVCDAAERCSAVSSLIVVIDASLRSSLLRPSSL